MLQLTRRIVGSSKNSFASLNKTVLASIQTFSTEPAHHDADTKTKKERVQLPKSARPKEMPKYKETMNAHAATDLIKDHAWARFDESIEIAVNLGVDPRKPNQSVKGMAKLPHGNGKTTRVGVFATGSEAREAKEAGADVVGSDELIDMIQGGDVAFDAIIAHPSMMSSVAKIGRILGPRGLMPNPKMGTVTTTVGMAVKNVKAGAINFKVERQGIIQASIGKVSFDRNMLLDNIRAFMIAVTDVKPEGIKTKYIKAVHMKSTMGPSIPIDTKFVDPTAAKFMLDVK